MNIETKNSVAPLAPASAIESLISRQSEQNYALRSIARGLNDLTVRLDGNTTDSIPDASCPEPVGYLAAISAGMSQTDEITVELESILGRLKQFI